MGWSEWMVYKPSLEEQLTLEKQARAALTHDNDRQVRRVMCNVNKTKFRASIFTETSGQQNH